MGRLCVAGLGGRGREEAEEEAGEASKGSLHLPILLRAAIATLILERDIASFTIDYSTSEFICRQHTGLAEAGLPSRRLHDRRSELGEVISIWGIIEK